MCEKCCFACGGRRESVSKSINLGAVYETVVAQELRAHGFDLYYYDNKKNGEVDFIIDDSSAATALPIEVKSGRDLCIFRSEVLHLPPGSSASSVGNLCIFRPPAVHLKVPSSRRRAMSLYRIRAINLLNVVKQRRFVLHLKSEYLPLPASWLPGSRAVCRFEDVQPVARRARHPCSIGLRECDGIIR